MPYQKIDINKFCNHKLIYESFSDSKEERGLNNIFISRSNIANKTNCIINFEFDYCFEKFDNIICDSQHIPINSLVKKLHFIGFGYWGDAKENLKIIYEDNSEVWTEIVFIDWSRPYIKQLGNSNFKENINIKDVHTVISSGQEVHLIYLHDCICEISNDKKVKEIVLPDNLLMHIFAITIEN